jgi:hypothetical protein
MKSVAGFMHIEGKNMQWGLCVIPKGVYVSLGTRNALRAVRYTHYNYKLVVR